MIESQLNDFVEVEFRFILIETEFETQSLS